VGALNCYSGGSAAFPDDDVEVGLQFATHAAIVLANAQAYLGLDPPIRVPWRGLTIQ